MRTSERLICFHRHVSEIFAVTTPVDKERVDSCVLKHFFFWGGEWSKKKNRQEWNALCDTLRMSCSQNFAADAAKKTALCSFLKQTTSPILKLLICFRDVVCFNGKGGRQWREKFKQIKCSRRDTREPIWLCAGTAIYEHNLACVTMRENRVHGEWSMQPQTHSLIMHVSACPSQQRQACSVAHSPDKVEDINIINNLPLRRLPFIDRHAISSFTAHLLCCEGGQHAVKIWAWFMIFGEILSNLEWKKFGIKKLENLLFICPVCQMLLFQIPILSTEWCGKVAFE